MITRWLIPSGPGLTVSKATRHRAFTESTCIPIFSFPIPSGRITCSPHEGISEALEDAATLMARVSSESPPLAHPTEQTSATSPDDKRKA
jgi:hypothetical protein